MLRGVKASLSVSSFWGPEREGLAAVVWFRACLVRARELTALPAMAWERAIVSDLWRGVI
jgi:hypothetical protein